MVTRFVEGRGLVATAHTPRSWSSTQHTRPRTLPFLPPYTSLHPPAGAGCAPRVARVELDGRGAQQVGLGGNGAGAAAEDQGGAVGDGLMDGRVERRECWQSSACASDAWGGVLAKVKFTCKKLHGRGGPSLALPCTDAAAAFGCRCGTLRRL